MCLNSYEQNYITTGFLNGAIGPLRGPRDINQGPQKLDLFAVIATYGRLMLLQG